MIYYNDCFGNHAIEKSCAYSNQGLAVAYPHARLRISYETNEVKKEINIKFLQVSGYAGDTEYEKLDYLSHNLNNAISEILKNAGAKKRQKWTVNAEIGAYRVKFFADNGWTSKFLRDDWYLNSKRFQITKTYTY